MKNRHIIIFLTVLFLPVFVQSQNASLSFKLGGTGIDNVHDIYTDPAGNIYLTGSFSGTVDFDPGAGSYNIASAGNAPDVFFAKYGPTGAFKFAKRIGSSNLDEGNGIRTDASGNIIVSGIFSGIVDFDPNTGIQELNSLVNLDVFIAKYDSSGNYIFAEQIQGMSYVTATGLEMDPVGNIYLCGNFLGPCNFDPSASNYTLNGSAIGNNDCFIACYNSSGTFVYAKEIFGAGAEYIYDFSVDASQQVYITGYYEPGCDFDPGAGIQTLPNSGMQDIFFAKYDNSGNLLFARQMGGSAYESGGCVTTDSQGNILVSGRFSGTVDFDPGTGISNLSANHIMDMFLGKYDAQGNLIFISQFDEGEINEMKTDASDIIYITGYYTDICDFDPSLAVVTDTAFGANDIFLASYRSDGSLAFNWNMGGVSAEEAVGLHIDTQGIFICGDYYGSLCLNNDALSPVLNNSGNSDVFLAKYSLNPNIAIHHELYPINYNSNFYIGTVPVGNSSGPEAFIIKNTGYSNLLLNGSPHIQLLGLNASEFTIDTSMTQFVVAPGDSTIFTVNITPTSSAEKIALIRIPSNSTINSIFSFRVTGNSEPEINITNTSINYPSGSVYTFAPLNVGSSATSPFFIIENTGNDTLSHTGIPKAKIIGQHASDFAVSTQPGSTVAPGSTTQCRITFTPSSAGVRNAQLVIENNDVDESIYIINLEGSGTAPICEFTFNGIPVTSPNQVVMLDTVNAGSNTSFDCKIKNTGNADLLLTGNPLVNIGNPYNDFSVNTTGLLTTIPPGDSTLFILNVHPDTAGFYIKSINVATNGGTGSPLLSVRVFARDTITPVVENVWVYSADGTYTGGNEILISVGFNEPVQLTGNPSIQLNSGGTAYYLESLGTTGESFQFLYTVGPTDATTDLNIINTSSLVLLDGEFTDTSGNDWNHLVPYPSMLSDNVIIDPQLLTAQLTSNVTQPIQNDLFNVTVNFTWEIMGFDTSDIDIVNGVLLNFLTVIPGKTYTFEVFPELSGIVTVNIPRNAVSDSLANGNTPSNTIIANCILTRQRLVWDKGWANQFHFNGFGNQNTAGVLFSTGDFQFPWKVEVNNSNELYYAGTFEGTGDIDPDTSQLILNGSSQMNVLLARYTSNGLLLNAKFLESSTNCLMRDMKVDDFGNMYVAGTINDTLDVDPGPGTVLLIKEGWTDGFLAKYDPGLNLLWAIKLGSSEDSLDQFRPQSDFIQSMSIDEDNNVVIGGTIRGIVDFDPSPGVTNITTTNNGFLANTYFAKYDQAGNLIFAHKLDGSDGSIFYNMRNLLAVTTGQDNSIYLAGIFENSIDMDPGPATITFSNPSNEKSFYLAKYDPSGNYVFSQQLAGYNGSNNYYNDYIEDIEIDKNDNIYIAGELNSQFDFDPGAQVFQLSNQPFNSVETNIFIAGYDNSGNFRFAKQFGETVNGGSSSNALNELFVDSLSQLYITGCYLHDLGIDLGGPQLLWGWGYPQGYYHNESFFAIYDSLGNYQFATLQKSRGTSEYISGVTLDHNNDVILTGIMGKEPNFDYTGQTMQAMDGSWISASLFKYTDLDKEFQLKQNVIDIPDGGVYNFGVVNVGSSSGNKTFSIFNRGAMNLYLTSNPRIVISGANPSDFSVSQNQTIQTVAEGDSTYFYISFNPSVTGLRSALITILNNDGDEGNFSFTITGGVSPEMDLQENSVSIADGGTFNFGNVTQLGSLTKTFTILNTDAGTLQLPSLPVATITGPGAMNFSLDVANTSHQVANGNSTTFDIIFSPASAGVKSAILTINNNDPDEAPYNINLNGTGTDVTAPYITQVTSFNQDKAFNEPDTILISVIFNEPVNITGIPELGLNSGGNSFYLSGSVTGTVNFRYVIQAGESSLDLDYTSVAALQLQGGTISDNNGNLALLVLPPAGDIMSLGGSKNMVVDTQDPVPNINTTTGPYIIYVPFLVTVTFSEPVSGLTPFDIQVSNAQLSAFSYDSLTSEYTMQVTPQTTGIITVDVPYASAFDIAGNPNTSASNSYNVTTGIDEQLFSEHAIMLYPNPATTHITVSPVKPGLLLIYNLLGEAVFEKQIDSRNTQVEVDLSELPAGLYLLKIKDGSIKFIKH